MAVKRCLILVADEILTEEKMEKLIVALGKGQKTFTKKDALKVLRWANRTLIDMALLDLVLSGQMIVEVKGKELFFGGKVEDDNANSNANLAMRGRNITSKAAVS